MPGIVELEFYSEKGLEFINTMYLTPITDEKTGMFFAVSIRKRILPLSFFSVIGAPILQHVLKQDIQILSQQRKTIKAFGGEQFISTHLDFARKNLDSLLVGDPSSEFSGERKALI